MLPVAAMAAAFSGSGVKAQSAAQPPTLAIQVNDTSLRPGETLVTGVTVDNPGGGPLADFYFVILLPDGSTVVSAGPGVGARIGTIGNLRSLVPVATSISLANAFPFAANPFFSYTFTGNEPIGTYRIYLAAVRAGALGDGAIGPGELLAVATQDFQFGVSLVEVDTSRAVTNTVSPAGGSVQVATAGGIIQRLTVPAGAVDVPTAITLAPLIAVENSPAGPLVAGISAEPSGLVFDPPATLTITLPPGFQAPAFGLRGFIADSNGQNAQVVPATLAGNVVTLRVPHFSVVGLTLNTDWLSFCAFPLSPAMTTACQQLRPLFDAEVARIAAQGGPIGAGFKAAILPALQAWAQSGVLPRLINAQTPGLPDPFEEPKNALVEWVNWAFTYNAIFGGLLDGSNGAAGVPLGSLIDVVQAQARLTHLAGMNGINIKCLADKANVLTHLDHIDTIDLIWSFQFNHGPFVQPVLEYCVDVRIDAAPPPVLTPGQPVQMAIDIRMRFTDGVEFPGHGISVSIAATNATVAPAGGVLPSPIAGNVTLTPSTTSSVVTITAAPVEEPGRSVLGRLPVRTRTFQAGQTQDLVVTSSLMFAESSAVLPTLLERIVADNKQVFAPTQSVSAPQTEQVTDGGTTYRATSLNTGTRTVGSAGGAVTITGLIRLDPGLSAQPPRGIGGPGATATTQSDQRVCFTLPRPFQATYSVQSNAQSDPDQRFATVLSLRGGGQFLGGGVAGDSGSVNLPAGNACVDLRATWACHLDILGNPECDRPIQTGPPGPLTADYTVFLRPAP